MTNKLPLKEKIFVSDIRDATKNALLKAAIYHLGGILKENEIRDEDDIFCMVSDQENLKRHLKKCRAAINQVSDEMLLLLCITT